MTLSRPARELHLIWDEIVSLCEALVSVLKQLIAVVIIIACIFFFLLALVKLLLVLLFAVFLVVIYSIS